MIDLSRAGEVGRAAQRFILALLINYLLACAGWSGSSLQVLAHPVATEIPPPIAEVARKTPAGDITDLSKLESALKDIETNAGADTARMAKELFDLAAQVRALSDKKEAELLKQFGPELGRKKFKELVDKNGISISVPEVGSAELSNVNGAEAIKIRHLDTEVSIVFMNMDEVDEKSDHYNAFVARQLIDAGVTRSEAAREKDRLGGVGRDLLQIDYRLEAESDRMQIAKDPTLFLRPDRLTMERAKQVWRASYKKPTRGDNMLATYCMILQAGVACGVAALKMHAGLTHEFHWEAAALSAIFGGVIGRWVSLYRNIKTRGPLWWQTTKSGFISVAYALLLDLWISKPVDLAYILINVTENNLAKVQFEDLATIRSERRINQKKLVVLGYETPVNQASFEAQNLYLIPFTLRLSGLLGIPGADALLIASIPLAQAWNLNYAKRIGSNLYELRRLAWERSPLGLAARLTLGTTYRVMAANFSEWKAMFTGSEGKGEEHLAIANEYWQKAKFAPSYYAGSLVNGSSKLLTGKFFGSRVPSIAELGDRLGLGGKVSGCASSLRDLATRLQKNYEIAIDSGKYASE